MALTAYKPLQVVYQFHEQAENWVMRRYQPGVLVDAGAHRTRGPLFASSLVAVFRDRSTKTTAQAVQGQRGPARATIYTTTRLLPTDDQRPEPQPADLLMCPADGTVWQVVATADWDEAAGYQVTIERCGTVSSAPWN